MTFALMGINMLILMAVWHFMVKKTLLDTTRDKLFELRDEVRRVHLERGWSIGDEVYGNLREMINAYLRYTETYSVWNLVAVRTELSQPSNASLRDHLAAHFDAKFKTSSPEQQKYIRGVRDRAGTALMEYSVYSSGLLLLVAVMATPYFIVSTVLKQCNKGFSALHAVLVRDALHLGRVTGFVWALSIGWVAAKVIDRESIDLAISNHHYRLA